jgi:hypothetical protein
MKARQSKQARVLFNDESKGRAILKGIREAYSSSKNAHIIANLKVDNSTYVQVKEL